MSDALDLAAIVAEIFNSPAKPISRRAAIDRIQAYIYTEVLETAKELRAFAHFAKNEEVRGVYLTIAGDLEAKAKAKWGKA